MNFDRILKYITYAGLFLVPFVPLYVSTVLFFPFITGKAFLFRVIVEIIFGSWLILALRNSDYRPRKSWVMYALSVFVIVIALADIFSGHFLKSFWSNFERMEGLVTLLHLLAYFFVLISFVKSEKIWDRLMQTSIFASLVIGGWGLFQLFGKFTSIQSGTRLDGSFGNASYLAVYMLFHIFITAYLLTRHQGGKFLKWLYGLIILFQAFILFFTATRGAILGLVGGVFLTFILLALFENQNRVLRKVSVGIVILVIVLTGLFFSVKNTSFVQGVEPLQRLASIDINERTTTSRFMIWGVAWEAFKERPVLGWGQENFIFAFERYYNPGMYNQEPWFDRAHNIVFDWLIAGGILGLLSYLAVLFFAVLALWRSAAFSTTQKSLLTGLLAGYFFHNFFVFDNIGSYLLFIFILGLIHSKGEFSQKETVSQDSLTYANVFAPFIIVLVVLSLYFFVAKGYLTSHALLQALAPQQEGPAKNLEFYKKALAYDTYGNQEIREQLLSAASSVINLEVEQSLKEEFITLGIDEMQKQVDSNPESARHQVFMGSFLNRVGLYDDAIPYLEKALEISPKKQNIHFEFVTNYLNSGQTEKAVDAAKTTFELDEGFATARRIYATTLIYNGESQLAEEVLIDGFGTAVVGDDRLAQAYFRVGEIEKSIAIWQEIIRNNPNNIQYRTSLAATYLAGGFREESINEIQKAIEVDPNFKEQGEFFIQEIRAGRNP